MTWPGAEICFGYVPKQIKNLVADVRGSLQRVRGSLQRGS